MICNNCNVENNSNCLYCYNCGSPLNKNNLKICVDSKNKTISLTCGIICLVTAFIFNILCFIPGIISIIYAVKYKKECGKLGVGFGLSLGGMIYSFLVFLLGIFLFFIIFVVSSNSEYDEEYEYEDYNAQYTYNLSEL